MVNTKVQTDPGTALIDLIKRSEVIGMVDKEDFINLIPSLTKDQIGEITNFFKSAELEINSTRNEYEKKKKQLFTSYLPEIGQAFNEAKKIVYKAKEQKNKVIDQKNNQKLLDELKNL